MNFKEWIFPLTLAMTMTYAFQYFMGPDDQQGKDKSGVSGQTFKAPEVEQAHKPLNLVVDFEKSDKEEQKHVVETDKATYLFSSKGAVLKSLQFGWQGDQKQIHMLPENSDCFVLALDKNTPQDYEFVGQTEKEGVIAVEYKAKFDQGDILKTFVIHKGTYQVDVKVSIDYDKKEAKKAESVRIFMPMPVAVDGTEDVKGIVNKVTSAKDIVLQDIALDKADNLKQFWFEPKVFGFSNKFLVQVLTAGDEHILRAYLQEKGSKQYQAIFETKPCEKDTTYRWSFYFGPKSMNAMTSVAPFLEQTLDYGWLSFVSKPMLSLLQLLKNHFGDYGVAILLLTLLLKLLLLPFTLRGEKSMKQQAEMQKKMAYIKQKYAHDKAAMDRANAELIQKHGLPMMGGCLPMLLNIPVFIALNRVLSNSIELYGASFLWLPDLAAKDPYYILGILTGICMIFTPMGGGANTQQAAMRYGTALFLGTVVTYLSSGLALFIFANTLIGLLQTRITKMFTR